jgi:hypothetical protein
MTEVVMILWSIALGLIVGISLTQWSVRVKLREAAESGRRLEWSGRLYNITEDRP